jgi:TRAP-type C4-dicarboxylate transport system permease large subunit
MITILIEIGQVTPPVGLNLSVLTAITNGEISLGRTAIATIPYWGILLLAIGIITLVPSVVLILPNAIF